MSTNLPHGIIQINEGNISWYGDITANWQLIDSKIGIYDAAIATIPAPANTGTLTINYGSTTIAMFGADDAGDVSADIPAPGDGTLTIAVNGATAGTFTANQAGNANVNIAVPTRTSQLTNDSGYLTSSSNLDASKLTSGTVDIARLPQGALERLVKVANEAARYALTMADVQLGDTVQQLDTGIMYVVTDTDHLDSAAGYTEYAAGTAASVPWSGVTGKPTFAAVATSGAYSDLTGTPTIPTVNNATLTIQKNGTTVKTFTANASSNVTANITVPTKTSDLTNDSGFITGVTWNDVSNKPSFATVATSGSYNDLSNKPTIPKVNNATLKIQKNGTDVKTFTANASSDVTCNITVPTKTSELTNDSGFLTSHQSLSNYSTLANTIKSLSISGRTITYTKGDNTTGTLATQDNNTWTAMVGATSSSNGSVGYVNAVPPKDGYNTKYLRADGTWQVPPDHTYNVYNKTLTIQKNGTNVATFTSNSNTDVTANITVPTKTSDLTNDSGFITGVTWNDVSNKPTLATVATSGSYNDLSNKPTIPTVNNATLTIQKNGTKVKTFTANASSNVTCNITVPTKTSDLTNDSGFLTSADLLPIGSYIQFAGSQAPDGFLVCNGGEISRTTYSKLFAVIGTTYGSGDGSTTFNLPNLTDRFLQGSSISGAVKDAGLPNITGKTEPHYRYDSGGYATGAFLPENGGGGVNDNNPAEYSGCSGSEFNASRSNSIYGNSSTVQPPALTCLICIKY